MRCQVQVQVHQRLKEARVQVQVHQHLKEARLSASRQQSQTQRESIAADVLHELIS